MPSYFEWKRQQNLLANFLLFYSSFIPVCDRLVPHCLGRAGFDWIFYSKRKRFPLIFFLISNKKQKWAANPRVCRFRFTFFSVLSETVFAHIYPVMNKNEFERRTLRLLLDWMNGEWRFLRGGREGGMGCMVYLQGPINSLAINVVNKITLPSLCLAQNDLSGFNVLY